MANAPAETVIRVRDLVVDLKSHRVLNGVNLDVYHGEILGFVGASGAGKSVLLRTIIGLLPKRQGRIEVLDVDLDQADEDQRQGIERRWGILFPARRVVLLADRRPKRRISDPRISRSFGSPHDRDGDHQTGNGRPEAGRLSEISVGVVRRHDQARRARPGAGARSRDFVPGRTHLPASTRSVPATSTSSF